MEQENFKPNEIEKSVTEDLFALIDGLESKEPGMPQKEGRKVEILGEEKTLGEKQGELTHLIDEVFKEERKKEAKGEIPEELRSISVTKNDATFTFDYFNEIVLKRYNFNSEKWEVMRLPKLEFDQPEQ